MDDFESFKDSREKMDPTSRKMSDHQWKQAYAAYRSARERVGGSEAKKGKGKQHRQSKSASSTRGMHSPSSASVLNLRRQKVREQSAYADLRLMVDVFAWVAIAIVALSVVVSLFFYTSVPAALIALLGALLQLVGIIVARLLVQVLIDIPDIALFRSLQEASHESRPSPDSEH